MAHQHQQRHRTNRNFFYSFFSPLVFCSPLFFLLLSFGFNVHNFGNKTESPFKISASAEMCVWLPSYTTTSYQNSGIVSNANQTIFFRFLVRYNFKSNRLFAFLLLLLFYSLFVFVLLFFSLVFGSLFFCRSKLFDACSKYQNHICYFRSIGCCHRRLCRRTQLECTTKLFE